MRIEDKHLNHNFFDKQNPISDCWAGFIAADGSITKNRPQLAFHLAKQDIEILENFKKQINSSNKIHIRKNSTEFRITSKKIIHDLSKFYNIIPQKSLILKPPKRKSLDFIRGYFYGDGYLFRSNTTKFWQCGFIGTYKMLLWIQSYFKDLSKSKVIKVKDKKCYTLRYCGNKLVPKIIKRIFQNAPFVLERKFKIYQSLYV